MTFIVYVKVFIVKLRANSEKSKVKLGPEIGSVMA